MSFTPELLQQAAALLTAARARSLKIATAESCTGGLIAGVLTEIAGSSDVFERGFVTYSNQAKTDLLGVPVDVLKAHGAVSAPVAEAMVLGTLKNAKAQIAVAVTGIAGPGGGTPDKPIGLVYIGATKGGDAIVEEHRFGDIGRDQIRLKTVAAALTLLRQQIL